MEKDGSIRVYLLDLPSVVPMWELVVGHEWIVGFGCKEMT
jgi:hypothetical protein